MKLPYGKINWKHFGLIEIIVFVETVFFAFSGKIPLFSIEWILNNLIFFVLVSFLVIYVFFRASAADIFHTEVKFPVDPYSLEIGKFYWLNGETHVIYRGQNEHSGKFMFNVYGFGDLSDPKVVKRLVLGEVKKYISLVQEAPEPETQTVS